MNRLVRSLVQEKVKTLEIHTNGVLWGGDILRRCLRTGGIRQPRGKVTDSGYRRSHVSLGGDGPRI